jgi:hypothetical protein
LRTRQVQAVPVAGEYEVVCYLLDDSYTQGAAGEVSILRLYIDGVSTFNLYRSFTTGAGVSQFYLGGSTITNWLNPGQTIDVRAAKNASAGTVTLNGSAPTTYLRIRKLN